MGTRPAPTVLLAVNPFKESLSARDVAAVCARAAAAAGWRVDALPGADGGDGLIDALEAAGRVRHTTVHEVEGPLATPVEAPVAWLGRGTAVIESRHTIGLGLVPSARRQPGRVSTRGLGELIAAGAAAGAQRIFVGLGGSATMDGGVGMASAWGWRFLDDAGVPLPARGGSLERVRTVRAGRAPPVECTALVDVINPLLGAEGARVYAAQKGASPADAEGLARGLERLVAALGGSAASVADEPGAGAAGGLGFGLRVFARAVLREGAAWTLDQVGFADRLRRADAVVTAEGAFDATSWQGKLPGMVIRAGRRAGVPVGLLAPRAEGVPADVVVESGGGRWDEAVLEERAAALFRRLGRLPPP